MPQELAQKKLKLIEYPNPILLKPSKECEGSIDTILKVREMINFIATELPVNRVLGLAAIQVGIPLRFFYALGEIYINPEIIWETKAPKSLCHEACFSLGNADQEFPVYRSDSVKLFWYDSDLQEHEERFNSRAAQVIQHEMDHLNGKLCCGNNFPDTTLLK